MQQQPTLPTIDTFTQILPDLVEDPEVNKEVQLESMNKTFRGLVRVIDDLLDKHPGINMVYPFDGSIVFEEQFDEYLEENSREDLFKKIKFVGAAKVYKKEEKTYELEEDLDNNNFTIVGDDIWDQGESSGLIKKAGNIPDEKFMVVALTTKKNRNFSQGRCTYKSFRRFLGC